MKKIFCSLLLLFCGTALGQYYPPISVTAQNSSGQATYVNVDTSGDMFTNGSGSGVTAGIVPGFVPPVAITATGPSGNQVYLKADANGNLFVNCSTGCGGGGSGTTNNALTLSSNGSGGISGTTFNGAVAVTISYNSIGAASAGANSNITSLTGLTTPLSVAQGGSGAGTLSGLLFGNGTSAFTAATATQVNTVIATLTGCSTATFVYTPQAADCVAPGGGGGGTTTNALTINNAGSGVASGGTFNGASAITISYNSIGAASAGANSNITSLTGLTTPLSVAQGGTGGTSLSGLATSGANSNITSLTGLTTFLSVAQGGSGAGTLSGFVFGNGTSAMSAATATQGFTLLGAGSAAQMENLFSSLTGCTTTNFVFVAASGTCVAQTGGGSGTVNSGTSGFISYYASTGSAVSYDPLLDDGITTANTLTYAGTGGVSSPIVTTTGSGAGTIDTYNAAGTFFTAWGSAATANNTINGPATAPTTGDLLGCTTSSTTCTLTDTGILATAVATASSTTTFTNKSISGAQINSGTVSSTNGGTGLNSSASTGIPSVASGTWSVNTTPAIGAATATSLIASGIVDGEAPITVTTGATATLGGTYSSGYTINEEATAATAITYTLPTAAAGKQYCVSNAYNGAAATTGTLELLTSASGQFIIYTDGTLSATGGFVQSGGAAADAACVVGVDATHWLLYVSRGTWTKH